MDSPGVLANNANLWTPLRTLLGLLSKVQNMDLEQFLKFSQSQESSMLLFLDLQPALLSQHPQQSSGVCPVNERPGYFWQSVKLKDYTLDVMEPGKEY